MFDIDKTPSLSSTPQSKEPPKEAFIADGPEKGRPRRRSTECIELSSRYEMRRAFSESRLLDCIDIRREWKDGDTLCFITAGDVDMLSYLHLMLRYEDLEYCLLSTWCMSAEDILQIRQWIEGGRIRKMDFYVGEIFPGTYRIEWNMLHNLVNDTGCGRVAVFRNHSKVFSAHGTDFDFTVLTSANVNTNPRTEQGVIIISPEVHTFYKDYYDGITTFDKEDREAQKEQK